MATRSTLDSRGSMPWRQYLSIRLPTNLFLFRLIDCSNLKSIVPWDQVAQSSICSNMYNGQWGTLESSIKRERWTCSARGRGPYWFPDCMWRVCIFWILEDGLYGRRSGISDTLLPGTSLKKEDRDMDVTPGGWGGDAKGGGGGDNTWGDVKGDSSWATLASDSSSCDLFGEELSIGSGKWSSFLRPQGGLEQVSTWSPAEGRLGPVAAATSPGHLWGCLVIILRLNLSPHLSHEKNLFPSTWSSWYGILVWSP